MAFKFTYTYPDGLSDPYFTLKEWKNKIEELIEQHGEDTVMFTDAGHNNCQLVIDLTPKE